MARPTFTPRFEETETAIRERILQHPDLEGWRKEPGDFMYDAIAPQPAEIKQIKQNQDYILKNAFAQYAEGEHLDALLAEVGLTRFQATPCKRTLAVEAVAGVVIPKDYTASTVVLDSEGNPIEYTVDEALTFVSTGTQNLTITCKQAGTVGNVPTGSEFIFTPPIPGVRVVTDLGATIPGTDTESDEDAWKRFDFKVKNPDTGGNKNDYVRWVMDNFGDQVGKVKVIPRWNGNGTVKVLLVGTDYTPASQAIVDDVQEYLDPGETGLGDGKAPCGAQVSVRAATAKPINITATVTYFQGVDPADVQTNFEDAVKAYLAEMAFTGGDIIVAKIGSLLIGTYGVSNYSGLTVNGGTADIPVGAEEVAVLGTVTLT